MAFECNKGHIFCMPRHSFYKSLPWELKFEIICGENKLTRWQKWQWNGRWNRHNLDLQLIGSCGKPWTPITWVNATRRRKCFRNKFPHLRETEKVPIIKLFLFSMAPLMWHLKQLSASIRLFVSMSSITSKLVSINESFYYGISMWSITL